MISRRVHRAVPPIGRFVEVDGTIVHYVDRGEGPPIVMIHGLAGVLQNFTYALVERLAHRFRVIALDRLGAGYSVRRRSDSASLSAQGTLIAHFIEKIGVQRPLVAGHSLGGALALALALDHAHIPRALALIAPLTQPPQRTPKPFRALEIGSPLLRALFAHTLAVPAAMLIGPHAVRNVFDPERVPADFATAGGGMLGLRPSQYYHASSDMIAAKRDMPSIVARYPELNVPVHVLFGTEDAVLDYRVETEELPSQLRDVDVTLIPGGHMLPVTQPDVVAAWISGIEREAR